MPESPQIMTVDGHTFRVSKRPGRPGQYDFAWLSGPHDYGFTAAHDGTEPMTPADFENAIRSFLVQINPETGYID